MAAALELSSDHVPVVGGVDVLVGSGAKHSPIVGMGLDGRLDQQIEFVEPVQPGEAIHGVRQVVLQLTAWHVRRLQPGGVGVERFFEVAVVHQFAGLGLGWKSAGNFGSRGYQSESHKSD